MKKFRAGVVGTGFIGATHIEALRRLGNVEVVALTETVGAKEKAEQMCVPQYFDDYKKMVDSCNLDTIHICTPNFTHCEMSVYAMERGVNVVCEKPMTCTVEEARQMVEVAKKTGMVNAVNFHNRFFANNKQLHYMVKGGELGEIHSVHGGYIQDWLFYDTDFNWRLLSAQSGKTRAIADIGSHWMDLAEYITGNKIVEVFADFSTVYKKRKRPTVPVETFANSGELKPSEYEEVEIDTEDMASILLRFDNGAIGNAMISQMFAGKRNSITMFISGNKMSAEINNASIESIILGTRGATNHVWSKDAAFASPEVRDYIGVPAGHTEGFPDAIRHAFKAIYSKIADKTLNTDFATFEDGLHSMTLNECLFESAQSQKWVKVKGENRA